MSAVPLTRSSFLWSNTVVGKKEKLRLNFNERTYIILLLTNACSAPRAKVNPFGVQAKEAEMDASLARLYLVFGKTIYYICITCFHYL